MSTTILFLKEKRCFDVSGTQTELSTSMGVVSKAIKSLQQCNNKTMLLLLPYCARNRRVIHKLDGSELLDDRDKTETTQVTTSRDSVHPSTRYITYYTLLESRGPGKGREGGRPTVLPSTNRRIDVYTTQPYTTQPLLGRLTFSSQTWALFSFLYFFSFFYHHHHTHTTDRVRGEIGTNFTVRNHFSIFVFRHFREVWICFVFSG